MFYSIIIPVYNRPDEVEELLESLVEQTYKNFEVIIVEDGSSIKAEQIVKRLSIQHPASSIQYYYKENSGPGDSRNFGFQRAKGDYYIVLDSDCIVPPDHLEKVNKHLSKNYLDAFGGPDKAHQSFTPIQKAISYSMTSYLTTGGIRGKKKHVGKFHPRSFNLGISKEVFEKTNGFSKMRYGEDIEFSIRMINKGFKVGLIEEAFVYHKRRANFNQFFKQVFHSGQARINLYKLYRNELKLTHFFPAIFTLYILLTIALAFINYFWFQIALIPLLLYVLLIFIDALIQTRGLTVAFLSIIASFVQLIGYGIGFMMDFWRKIIL